MIVLAEHATGAAVGKRELTERGFGDGDAGTRRLRFSHDELLGRLSNGARMQWRQGAEGTGERTAPAASLGASPPAAGRPSCGGRASLGCARDERAAVPHRAPPGGVLD